MGSKQRRCALSHVGQIGTHQDEPLRIGSAKPVGRREEAAGRNRVHERDDPRRAQAQRPAAAVSAVGAAGLWAMRRHVLKREAAQVAKKVAEIEQLRSLMKAGTLS